MSKWLGGSAVREMESSIGACFGVTEEGVEALLADRKLLLKLVRDLVPDDELDEDNYCKYCDVHVGRGKYASDHMKGCAWVNARACLKAQDD